MGGSEPVRTRRLTVFHTSDLHNNLDARAANKLRELKTSTPDSLVLDSGDAIWAGNAFWRWGGEPILDVMNSVPYDAMCLGNREYHFLDAGIRAKLSRAAFPVLSANLRASSSVKTHSARPPIVSHVLFNRSGVRAAVFGLTIPCITRSMFISRVSGSVFEQPIPEGVRIAESLRAECDVLIALTHIGIERDRELARSAPGIDLILGGHTHTVCREPERVGDTALLHCGSHGQYVCMVTIDIDARPRVASCELIPLREGVD